MLVFSTSNNILDSNWPDAYHHVKSLVQPDFIIADFFAGDTTRDLVVQFNVPIAVVGPR